MITEVPKYSPIPDFTQMKRVLETAEIPVFNVKEIVVAGDMGPCGGVNMAIQTTFEILDIADGRETVYANNPPVHNDLILEEFKERQLKIEPDINNIPAGSIWILSAHGTNPATVKDAVDRGILVVDTECQLVTKVRNVARRIERDGSGKILYFGTPNHPEPEAVIHSVPEEAIRYVDINEDPSLIEIPAGEKIWVLNQTTLSVMKVNSRVEQLRRLYPDADITNAVGICDATDNRQRAVREGIFGNPQEPIDLLIVVGSKTSHNTEELVRIGEEILGHEKSHRVNKAEEINPSWFSENIQRVGLTAGASVLDKFSTPILRWFKDRGARPKFLTGVENDLTFKEPSAQIEAVRRHVALKYNPDS